MMAGGDDIPRYDRDFLLSPAKRNQIIELAGTNERPIFVA